jgi:hypothetical protein
MLRQTWRLLKSVAAAAIVGVAVAASAAGAPVDASLLSAHQRLAIDTISLVWFQGQASFQQAIEQQAGSSGQQVDQHLSSVSSDVCCTIARESSRFT